MKVVTSTERFEVLWPGAMSAVPAIELAPRLDTLDGKRIAFLWDFMFRGDETFPMLAAQIRARAPSAKLVDYDEFGSIFGGNEHASLAELPARLRGLEVDAVVSGNGC